MNEEALQKLQQENEDLRLGLERVVLFLGAILDKLPGDNDGLIRVYHYYWNWKDQIRNSHAQSFYKEITYG